MVGIYVTLSCSAVNFFMHDGLYHQMLIASAASSFTCPTVGSAIPACFPNKECDYFIATSYPPGIIIQGL